MSHNRKFSPLRSLVLGLPVATLVAFAATVPQVRGQQPTPDKPEADAAALAPAPAATTPAAAPAPKATERAVSPAAEMLRAANAALGAGRSEEAARLLKSMKVTSMDPKDARRWRGMAVLAALRTGDRAWLDVINNDPEHFRNATLSATITAMRFMQDADYRQARALLDNIRDPQNLDEIPRRRYLELRARLEQLEGRSGDERKYVSKLVDFAGHWPGPVCQACHADPKRYGDDVTSLDVKDWWVGKRFSAILKEHGDAGDVRARAEKTLSKKPDDVAARLRLAYALRAQGQEARADAELRKLPWAVFPDRETKVPPRVAVFP